MSKPRDSFRLLYASALRGQLVQSGEFPLHQAYELGREALAEGVGVLELVLLHHDALAGLMLDRAIEAEPDGLPRAAEFLAECLSPFEMTLRGYRETNARLAQAHEKLKAETTERQRAEEALFHAQKLQAIGLLAGGVAHHFNNLLTVVLGNLELMRPQVAGNEGLMRRLEAARHGARRGAEVVRQLLTFSRQQILQPRPLDPAAWLAEIVPLITSSLRGDITLDIEVRGAPPLIEVDPAELELALLNLTVNARDAMPNGGALKIAVERRLVDDRRLQLSGDFVVFEVSDTGEGVAPDIQARVFEPFFTTKQAGPGAGLGLSQVHGFAHQAGGAAELESAPGQGATVRLYLPSSRAVAETEPECDEEQPLEAGSARILLVEDDTEIADLAATLLEQSGYEVKVAHRAKAALSLLRSDESIDALFSDIVMPGGMDGLALARQARRLRPDLPILLASGYSDALKTVRDEGLPVIAKPYQGDDLRQRIEALLRGDR